MKEMDKERLPMILSKNETKKTRIHIEEIRILRSFVRKDARKYLQNSFLDIESIVLIIILDVKFPFILISIKSPLG